MRRYEVNREYFKWLCHLVYDARYLKKTSYQKLLTRLHEIDFEYILPMDGNRAEDGTDLRYRFAYEKELDSRMIARYLDDRPCSVLEMMIALSVRCEQHIMEDTEIGDRTGQWFWNMIVSLGLGGMSDEDYDENYVNMIVQRFLKRQYKRDGEGGLFTIKSTRRDLRTIDIWYQMHQYLEDFV